MTFIPDIAILGGGVVIFLALAGDVLRDILAERRNNHRLQIEAEMLRRQLLAAEKYSAAQQHREPGEEWKDWS